MTISRTIINGSTFHLFHIPHFKNCARTENNTATHSIIMFYLHVFIYTFYLSLINDKTNTTRYFRVIKKNFVFTPHRVIAIISCLNTPEAALAISKAVQLMFIFYFNTFFILRYQA